MPKNTRNLKPDALPTLNLAGKRKDINESGKGARLEKRRRIEDTKIKQEVTILYCNDLLEKATEERDPLDITNMYDFFFYPLFIIYKNFFCRKVEQDEIWELKAKLSTLEKENETLIEHLRNSESKIKHFEAMFGKIFTSGQMKRILDPDNKRLQWSSEDIASAISLQRVSPKAYLYLRSLNYPLPALTTLQKWSAL